MNVGIKRCVELLVKRKESQPRHEDAYRVVPCIFTEIRFYAADGGFGQRMHVTDGTREDQREFITIKTERNEKHKTTRGDRPSIQPQRA
jgi:hypothetical protein